LTALHKAKKVRRKKKRFPNREYPTTNFYPMYDFDRDQVNPVSSIRSIKLQRVIPRYELSTSDTRDEGVGPVYEINPAASGRINPSSTSAHTRKVKAKKVDNNVQYQRQRNGIFEFVCEITPVKIIDRRI